MVVVVKVGGSLAETPKALEGLGEFLSKKSSKYHFIVIPGGGRFSDIVRDVDEQFRLPPILSHQMAILAMNQYGLLLSHFIPDSKLTESIEDIKEIAKSGKVSILLPYRPLLDEDPFVPSWNVTSDSIAAYFAVKLGESKVVFLTDVDGIYDKDPKTSPDAKLLSEVSTRDMLSRSNRSCVDKFLPTFLKKNKLNCYVLNGRHPERLEKILLGKKDVICTQIKP
jgi:5-(aminomethyl)-3-furanmethanol phosphate kinase